MKKTSVLLACAMGAFTLVLSGCGGTTTEGSGSDSPSSSKPSKASASESTTSEPTTSESSETTTSASSFVDGVLTTPEMKIEITDHKVIPIGATGNEYGSKPVIAFWYKITNLTDQDVSPMNWIYVFTAYQDNNPNAENEISVASLPDDRFLDSQTENIKNGGTVENAMAYELDDETTPVDLVASDDLGMTEIGKATYNLN